MPRTTPHQRAPAPVTSSPSAGGNNPLRQLQDETEPPTGPHFTRCIGHSRALALRGIPVLCPACQACLKS